MVASGGGPRYLHELVRIRMQPKIGAREIEFSGWSSLSLTDMFCECSTPVSRSSWREWCSTEGSSLVELESGKVVRSPKTLNYINYEAQIAWRIRPAAVPPR